MTRNFDIDVRNVSDSFKVTKELLGSIPERRCCICGKRVKIGRIAYIIFTKTNGAHLGCDVCTILMIRKNGR